MTTTETWRNYAHEVVTDVMHSALPNLVTAQRARDQAEEFHDEIARQSDVLRAYAAEIEDLRNDRDAAREAERKARAECERLREQNVRQGKLNSHLAHEANRLRQDARAALEGGKP